MKFCRGDIILNESPSKMFDEAERLGETWKLEKACRAATFKKIASLDEDFRSATYFINVSPDILRDPRFVELFTQKKIIESGLDQQQIVIEITEKKSFIDYGEIERLVSHYVNQGFKISLDDFGSGYSGLIAMIASAPHYLKLDIAIVRDIHLRAYNQKLVKSIVTFASSVDAKLIAEGVEKWEEMETLVKHGVRYVQGFLFGRPEANPYHPSAEMRRKIISIVKRYDQAKADFDDKISGMVTYPMVIEKGTMKCQSVHEIFKKSPHLDHVVIIEGDAVDCMITRQYFYSVTGGAFGYQLFQNKPVESVYNADSLIVGDDITITMLAKLAMDRFQEDLYDPVLVVDSYGKFIGSITMKQVITKAAELEVRYAMSANPLTNLPGNEAIRHWIHDSLLPEYSIIYADLDNFKGFNDSYGFLMGNEMLRLTAKVLSGNLIILHEEAKLGHIGGDDFIIACPGVVSETALAAICREFDQAKLVLFKRSDVE